MKSPGRLEFTPEQIEALMERIEAKCLQGDDYSLLADLIRAMVWLNCTLQEKQLSIKRLRTIFGIKTETAKKLHLLAKGRRNDTGLTDEPDNTDDGNEEPDSPKNHGHRPASDYTQAKTIEIAHQTLQKGSVCPSCQKGKLFQLKPGSVMRIVGQPWLQVEIYHPERLRCPVCGKVFTAALPQEMAVEPRADSSAKAIVSLLKYRGGVPFYRQEQIQEILGSPISASEIWEMTESVADDLLPIHAVMCEHAAAAELLQNDDTTARVLSIAKERKESKEERNGTFTTGILATSQDIEIALFFTGRKHAGENLNDLMARRPHDLTVPIQQCDAAGRNVPEDHETQLSNCLAHARRKFYELVEMWPKIVLQMIGHFSKIFANDKSAPTDPEERLRWHQKHSAQVCQQMKDFGDGLIERKEVEPNSSLGKAFAYLNRHWEALTLFLRVPGVPLTNNDTERLIKRAVLNRKNAYFYRNETGAKIGDILMSVIETCVLNGTNPWDYLVAIQKYQADVRKNPGLWVPWAWQIRFKELASP